MAFPNKFGGGGGAPPDQGGGGFPPKKKSKPFGKKKGFAPAQKKSLGGVANLRRGGRF